MRCTYSGIAAKYIISPSLVWYRLSGPLRGPWGNTVYLTNYGRINTAALISLDPVDKIHPVVSLFLSFQTTGVQPLGNVAISKEN